MTECWIECSRDEIIHVAKITLDKWALEYCDEGAFQIMATMCKRGTCFNFRKFIDLLENHALQAALREREEANEKKCFFYWGKK